MSKHPGSDGELSTMTDTDTCFLCEKNDADYTTMVLVNDGHSNVGELEVRVHMSCLLDKGGTFWRIPSTPQLQGRDIQVQPLPYEEARRRYVRDALAFEEDFPGLAAELRQLKAIAEKASAERVGDFGGEGRCIWYGVVRPVDLLCALQAWWAELEGQAAHLAYEQESLF